jgi:hypothetical protein
MTAGVKRSGGQLVSFRLHGSDAAILSALARAQGHDLGSFCSYLLELTAARLRDYQEAADVAIGNACDVPADLNDGMAKLRVLCAEMPRLGWLVGHDALRDEEVLNRIHQLECLQQQRVHEAIA